MLIANNNYYICYYYYYSIDCPGAITPPAIPNNATDCIIILKWDLTKI